MKTRILNPLLRPHERGFTLIEVALVVVLTGILLTVAMRTGTTILRSAKYEETKQGMINLEYAVCGNPELNNNGARSDFGYIGDVGSMPPNLDALTTNPGSYSTWKGPYIRGRFQQSATDFKQDAWGVQFQYAGTPSITSPGSGENIVRAFANSVPDLTCNTVAGTIEDQDGSPPGPDFSDSITATITVPNGSGGTISKTMIPDDAGYFAFDSIPIGVRNVRIAYVPTGDTVSAFVVVNPASHVFSQYRFPIRLWSSTSGLAYVSSSDTVAGSPACTDVTFWVINHSGVDHIITSMSVTWSTPTAYYAQINWNGTNVFNKNGSPRGVSGSTYIFNAPQTIGSGETARVRVLDFRTANTGGGGAGVSMANVSMSIHLSDGTTLNLGLPSCP